MATQDGDADNLTVTTWSGRVQGLLRRDGAAFFGVPYARAPRFCTPEPLPVYEGVFDARRPSPAAPQLPSRLEAAMGPAPRFTSESECLTLNVWTPDVEGKFPVLFWLHGGAWATGSASWPWYDGARLAAEHRIVVVTANYRLGPAGYLDLRSVDPEVTECNFGFADQAAALEWVAEEICNFGGNRAQITVGGQSAGAHSAVLLGSAERTRHLVHRLLLQSGPYAWPLPDQDTAAGTTASFMRALSSTRSSCETARTAAISDLLESARILGQSANRAPGNIVPPLQPTRSEQIPWASPLGALEHTHARDILVGVTADEMRAFLDGVPEVVKADKKQVIKLLDAHLDDAAATYSVYEKVCPECSPGQIFEKILTAVHFHVPALDVAMQFLRSPDRHAYLYQFDWRTGPFGACHCVELPFLFGNAESWRNAPMLRGLDSDFEPIHRSFSDAIGRFVRDGNPGWPSFDLADPSAMRFGSHLHGRIEPRFDLLTTGSLVRRG